MAGEINLISIAKFRILVHVLNRIWHLLKYDIILTFQGQESAPDSHSHEAMSIDHLIKVNPYPKT